ncbi:MULTISPECIES: DUF3037 domain-containing protein [Pseudomonas syringae group genomosp. 2]|uniref:DUF3037 domain-containing protein n=4 Tax=Pseudomonas syringae group genomosp. 2 TaxID=251698 RepID=A0AAX1VM70_PSEAJ|nr:MULTISPECIES: DUF3037 domain-containing protein [Pseudomonas syringae group genomosp. 2]EGH21006.1 hypothetical protein PSYMO_05665 [Pseudomonas amygdali pv. mori str. 301020]KPX64541.1 hypothetical protein ALO35_101766 [Pseudomonas amygdali pv. lachrymans]KEZ28894.1 hypothetical protein A3SK_0102600 [Pseudomonas amygdali pv. tabaci str. 6605]KPY79348.1 hypothetical protein ALO60_101350 [Pseudomonas amygdali pv. tabaci]QOI04446.1 DUF3037 domain-containing protein [Pseudomonas savastanoi]
MRIICNYSILRFLPYPETGEFVNIGIVLFANNGDFRFAVETKRQRVTTFFPSLDAKIFIRARKEVHAELARLSGFFTNHRSDRQALAATFSHLVHPRETMMRFSEPGSVVAATSDQALKALFDHYVKHSFATKEYQEVALEKQLGRLLADVNLKQHYVDRKLGSADYPVKFPFVLIQGGKPVQAIKPLHLGHEESGKIYEHGDAWISRVRRLSAKGQLPPDTLFVAGPPIAGKPKLFKAYKEVSTELSAFPEVRVISAEEDRASMVSLIKEGIPASAEIA